MTELQALGITIGSAGSVAVATTGRAPGTEADPASGGLVLTHRSALRLNRTGGAAFADADEPHADDVVLEGFLSRVGDPVDILADDGSGHGAHDLVATAVTCLIEEAVAATGDRPVAAVLCHPAWWSAHTVELQRAVFTDAVAEVTLMPEPLAAARWLDTAHGPLADAAIVVVDLGATGTSATVVRTGSHSAVLATARTEDAAGNEFDLLTMRYVLANALGDRDIDPFDPATERRLAVLRENCRAAKEILSGNTATTVCVPLDDPGTRIRLVRDELEELLRGRLLTCLDLVRDVVHRAGIGLGDLDRVLLTGGGASIPLVTELFSGEFGLPVIAAPQPAHTAARGAAVVAADLLSHTVPDTLAEAETTELAVAAAGVGAPALPRATRPPRLGSGQRAGVLAAAVAALALLATGTIAVGPGLPSDAATPASTEQTTVPPTPGASAPAPPAAANEQDTSGPEGADTPAADRPEAPARSDSPAVQPGSPSVTAPPGAGQPVPDLPAGAQAPAAPAVSPPQPGAQPAPAPAPAPSPGGGYTPPPAPSTDGLGDTVGDTLGGVVGGVGEGVGKVGEGVGTLGEGIGEGVGGVLGGLGG
ncbi:Hsp70 family protein [Nocardia shimofusensis]|uniref:Hsp70 family protein n=1 Tax=Nocardia shimofusensis TaxID=228596 RepID=UPI0008352133|nr:Hsp70 family protein [Nocardia shimofusensis]